ncbi:YdcF family protein [Streptococcus sp. H31]|uniref:YdcF family protein n=1 Tax=Streptococcus huangxiaojuni TaxID=3237239 RepID=UPI0034A4BF73
MIYLFLSCFILFIGVSVWERRTIWLGILFCLMLASAFASLLPFIQYPSLWFYLIFLPIILLLSVGPLGFALLCLYKSFQLLYKEGRRWSNFLSFALGLGGLLIIFSYSHTETADYIQHRSWLLAVYTAFMLLVFYFTVQLIFFTTASVLNFTFTFVKKADYVLVLGAGLLGDRVTPLLASRIDKGISVYQKNPGSKLIMSGGQGSDESVSEAEAMRNYALKQGVPSQDIIVEKQSRNTRENMRFSKTLIKDGAPVAIVTSYYHLFRALTLARQEKLKSFGYGAKTRFYFTLNAFIREFIGYLMQTKKWQLLTFLILACCYCIFRYLFN